MCLSPIMLKLKFRKFFQHCEFGEDLFFQYLPINRPINIFLDENRTDKPLCAAHTVIFFGCRFFVKNTPGFELTHMRQLKGHLWRSTLNCSPYKRRTYDTLPEVSFNQIQGQISRMCLSPIMLKPKFRNFFQHCEFWEAAIQHPMQDFAIPSVFAVSNPATEEEEDDPGWSHLETSNCSQDTS